ncbi:MAG: aspartate 1-decarboxylase [Chloroflexota bacterium]
MQRIMMKSKIHRAAVTQADLYYEGSLTIDRDLMDVANLIEYEKVSVVNINNGERFETYVIAGERGSKVICLNGAAARKGAVGDRVIIISYANVDEKELDGFEPLAVLVDENNEVVKISSDVQHGTVVNS